MEFACYVVSKSCFCKLSITAAIKGAKDQVNWEELPYLLEECDLVQACVCVCLWGARLLPALCSVVVIRGGRGQYNAENQTADDTIKPSTLALLLFCLLPLFSSHFLSPLLLFLPFFHLISLYLFIPPFAYPPLSSLIYISIHSSVPLVDLFTHSPLSFVKNYHTQGIGFFFQLCSFFQLRP